MDGLHELTAAETTVTILDRTYRLAPLRLRDWGEIERRILAGRPDPLDLVLSKLDGLAEHLQRELLSRAYDDARRGRRVSASELHDWLSTPEGHVVQFWLSVRQHQPDVSLDDAEQLLLAAGSDAQAELNRAAEEALTDTSPGN